MAGACTLSILDEVRCRFTGLSKEHAGAVSKALTFEVQGARFTAAYKLGHWDGKVSLFSPSGLTYVNLLDYMLEQISGYGYDIHMDDRRMAEVRRPPPIDESFTQGCFNADGQPIVLRDYQIQAVNLAMEHSNGLFIMATGSGKSYVTGCVAKQYLQYGRVITIVPSTNLVTQTANSYRELLVPDVGEFYSELKEATDCTVTTWQSLQNYPEILEGCVCVIVDEAHGTKAKVLMEMLCEGIGRNIPHRYGFTGTLPDDLLSQLQIEAALGPIRFEKSAHELQEAGVLANCHIGVLQTIEDRSMEFDDYESEFKWLVTDPARLAWTADIIEAIAASGNTLVLVDRKETGFRLAEALGAVFIYGDVKTKVREKHYKSVRTIDNTIMIATKGVAAVGIDMPRLFNLVLFEVGKSWIKLMQSIGRGLRKASDKNHVNIYDVCASTKHSKRHLGERKKMYRRAKYPFTMERVSYRSPGSPARKEPPAEAGDVFAE
jgi:superfamily II DNA or RNA helicase